MYPTVRPPLPDVIDSTMLADFISCPTKYYYAFMRKLGPVYPSVDLVCGGAYAKGLETIRKGFYGPDKASQTEALKAGMMDALLEYGDLEPPEEKEQKSADRVCTALASYLDRYPLATDHLQPYMNKDGLPTVEFTFSMPTEIKHPTTGNPIIYAGRFDMVGVYQSQLWVVDDKTTSQLGPTWARQWQLRGQFIGYTRACREFKLPVVGACVRGTSFLKKSHGHEEVFVIVPEWMIAQVVGTAAYAPRPARRLVQRRLVRPGVFRRVRNLRSVHVRQALHHAEPRNLGRGGTTVSATGTPWPRCPMFSRSRLSNISLRRPNCLR